MLPHGVIPGPVRAVQTRFRPSGICLPSVYFRPVQSPTGLKYTSPQCRGLLWPPVPAGHAQCPLVASLPMLGMAAVWNTAELYRLAVGPTPHSRAITQQGIGPSVPQCWHSTPYANAQGHAMTTVDTVTDSPLWLITGRSPVVIWSTMVSTRMIHSMGAGCAHSVTTGTRPATRGPEEGRTDHHPPGGHPSPHPPSRIVRQAQSCPDRFG